MALESRRMFYPEFGADGALTQFALNLDQSAWVKSGLGYGPLLPPWVRLRLGRLWTGCG